LIWVGLSQTRLYIYTDENHSCEILDPFSMEEHNNRSVFRTDADDTVPCYKAGTRGANGTPANTAVSLAFLCSISLNGQTRSDDKA
jgi:hypothetical protein